MAIRSFADKDVEKFYVDGKLGKGLAWAKLKNVAQRKLDMMEAATSLNDLRSPPSNHLEQLEGDLKVWHSIRINDQYRIVFKWSDEGAEDVRIIDHH